MTTPKTIFTDDILKLRQGCGKEWCEEDDYTCGEDFPDDDGIPFCILCKDCNLKLQTLELCEKKHLKFVDDVLREIDEFCFGDKETNIEVKEELKQKIKQLEEK